MSTETETPIEEWRRSKPTKAHPAGREYVVLQGPGGGTIFRQGSETPDEARLRRSIETEAKRHAQADGTDTKPKTGPKAKGRRKDPTPGDKAGAAKQAQASAERAKGSGAKQAPTREQLAAAAELPLTIVGAFVGRAVFDCAWCAQRMGAAAPAAALDLAKSQNPYLQSLLRNWHAFVSAFAGGEGLTAFIIPPLMHHVAPAPMAEMAAPFLQMPPRPPSSPRGGHQHPPGPPRAETTGTTPGMPVPPAGAGQPPPSAGGQAPAGVVSGDRIMVNDPQTGETRALTPQEAAEMAAAAQQRIQSIEARLAAERSLAARHAQAPPGHGQVNVPTYRAADSVPAGSMAATALRQIQAAQEAAQGGGTLPNYQNGAPAQDLP